MPKFSASSIAPMHQDLAVRAESHWLTRLRLWTAMLFVDHGFARILFNRKSEIAPGVYRSSHPLPFQVRHAARIGVRTIINLRGQPHSVSSYLLEKEACERAGIRLIQFRLRSRDAPTTQEILSFAELCKEVEHPLLMHCKSGADRVGLASALYLMTQKNQPPQVAQRQLSLRFGHIRQAKTGILDLFLKRFARHHAAHSGSLLEWAQVHYDAAALRRDFRAQWWASFITDKILRRE